jgi:hypothetical protein
MHDPLAIARAAASREGRRARRALVALAMLTLGLAGTEALAQAAGRAYQVEIVIFAQPDGSLEFPPRQDLPPGGAPALPAPGSVALPADDPDAPPGAVAEEAAPLLPAGFSGARLPLALEAVAARLNRGGYQLLWHQAWVQPTVNRGVPELAVLAALGQGPATPDLSGVIHLSAGRFLHLGLDLELRSAETVVAELRQRRRIRLSAQQYFDHPRIGVIALVTPIAIDDQAAPPP